jgi:hypothetical protein
VLCTSSRQLAQQDPAEVGDEVLVDVLVVATQRSWPGPKAGGQPVRQPLPGGQQHPVCVGGKRSAQPGQRPLGLSAGTVTTSPQPAPRSSGSGGQLDREIPTPVTCQRVTCRDPLDLVVCNVTPVLGRWCGEGHRRPW